MVAVRDVAVTALPATVLVVDPGGLAPFGPAKWAVVPALVLVGVGASRVRSARWPLAWWAAFLVVVSLAAAAGLDPVYGWIGTPERHLGAVTWLLCALAFLAGQSAPGRGRVLWSATATTGAVGLWAAAESAGWRPIDLVGAGDRPVATLGSSAYLGATMALLVPVAAGVAWEVRGRWRWAAGAAAGLGAVALVASGARAAWAGTGLVLLVVAWQRHRGRVAGQAAVAVGLATLAVVGVAAVTGAAGRIPDLWREEDGGARGRLDEWRVAVGVIAGRPVLGTGPEGYRIAFGGAVDQRYEDVHGRSPLPDRAHSALLDVAATTGLAGAAAYVALLGAVGRIMAGAARRAPPAVAGAAVGVLAYWVQSLFLFPIGELEPVAWLLAGVVVAAVAGPGQLRVWRVPRALPATVAAVAVVAVAAGGLDVVADRTARTALDSPATTVEDPVRAARLRPDSLRYRLVAARVLAGRESSIGLDRAIGQLDHALEVSPLDPVARLERARLLVQRAARSGDLAHARTARRTLDDLWRDDPRNREVRRLRDLARQMTDDDGT